MQNTMNQIPFGKGLMHHPGVGPGANIDPVYAAWIDLMLEMMWSDRGAMAGTNGEPAAMAEAMERWNQTVIDQVPSEQLSVWSCRGGLGAALRVPRGTGPRHAASPRERHQNFQKNLIMAPAMAAMNAWWEENGPPEDPAAERPAGPAAQATA